MPTDRAPRGPSAVAELFYYLLYCRGGSICLAVLLPTLLSGWFSLRQTVHTHRASVHQAANLVAALLRVAGATAGLTELQELQA